MTEWKCTNCGNREVSDTKPTVCNIECCGEKNTFEKYADQVSPKVSKWKCTNCGNRISTLAPPIVCQITCCQASNSYSPIA